MALIGPDNAIAYAQFKLRGGWKNALVTTGVYSAAVVGVIILSVRMNPRFATSTLNQWTVGLMIVQTGLLLLFGAIRLSNAIRKDRADRHIESHRLMPINGVEAIVGYMTGATWQPMVLATATFIIGGVAAAAGGVPLAHWTFANIVLGLFAIFFWSAAVLAAFLMRGGVGILLGLMIGGMTGSVAIVKYLPGVTLLLGPIVGPTVYSFKISADWVSPVYGLSLLGQLAFGSIFVAAAARKYRRGEFGTVGTGLGVLLVMAWVATSAVGLRYWRDITPFPRYAYSSYDDDRAIQLVASMCGGMLVAMVPIGSAVWHAEQHRRRREIDPAETPPPGENDGRVAPWIIALLAAALLLPMPFALVGRGALAMLPPPLRPAYSGWRYVTPNSPLPPGMVPGSPPPGIPTPSPMPNGNWVYAAPMPAPPLAATLETPPIAVPDRTALIRTAAVLASFAVGMLALYRIVYRRRRRGIGAVLLWLIFTWAVPPLLDLLYRNLKDDGTRRVPPTFLLTASPAAAIAQLYNGEQNGQIDTGIAIELLLTAGMVIVSLAVKPPKDAPAPASKLPPPPPGIVPSPDGRGL